MNVDDIPIWGLFVATIVLVMLAIEAGYQVGIVAHRRAGEEKESPVSAIAGSILGLVAFMLAFTFSIVAERNDDRRGLVREEANSIRTTSLRSDFLPEADRPVAARLLREYVNARVQGALSIQSGEKTLAHLDHVRAEAERIQGQLWTMAVTNARKDMNSDVAALYIDSINEMIGLHAMRVAIGLQQRIPTGIWIVLYSLTFLGMFAVGYQTGIVGSERSWVRPVLAISFSMVVALIASLDRPGGGVLQVSQQPLLDLRESMTRQPSGAPQTGSSSNGEKAP
jgi:hypothetical protein